MTTPKEALYDKHVSPLMAEVISLCKEHKINMIADFSLGYDEGNEQNLYCTTCLPVDPDDEEGKDRIERARAEMMRKPFLAAFTIYGGKP